MKRDETYIKYEQGSEELVTLLVEEHLGWAKSIAKAVARAWNLDWQLDGLDGGSYEGLLFCARRFDPKQGVPFRAYARRRIHEASTEEARKSKSWAKSVGAGTQAEQDARELSASLFNIFPELREGFLPGSHSEGEEEGDREEALRASVRQLLAGASLISAFEECHDSNPQLLAEYKQLLSIVATLDGVHQYILWAVYWKDQSMRALAEEWKVDDLSVIREHKEILHHLFSRLSASPSIKKLKVRRGLRVVAQKLKRHKEPPPFAKLYGSLS